MNTSLSYPTIAAQQRKLAQLYDLQLDIMPQLFGNQIILMYYANFVEPIEVLDPDYTYEEIIQTISQIIRFPAYDNNLFDYAKRQLEDEYRLKCWFNLQIMLSIAFLNYGMKINQNMLKTLWGQLMK